MEIVIDGIVYKRQAHGGIPRIFTEILPRICDKDKTIKIILFTEGNTRQNTPKHSQIIHKKLPDFSKYLRPRRIWEPFTNNFQYLLRTLLIGTGKGKIWHSTYYTLPTNKWNGKIVVTVADMIHELFPKLFYGPKADKFRELKKKCILGADKIICISETTRKDLIKFYNLDPKSIYVTHLAYGDIFKPQKQSADESDPIYNKTFLLYIGTRPHYKNFNMLLKAYSMWKGKKEISLYVIGKPWTEDEKSNLSKYNLNKYVQLYSNIDDNILCTLYNNAVALVYPSLYEGFGIPLLEAMACGCPVIASYISSTIEVAGSCPIYFDTAKIEELINAFDIALIEGKDSERVKNGFEKVNNFSWEKTSAKTQEVYRKLS